jgi:hypothetical protein
MVKYLLLFFFFITGCAWNPLPPLPRPAIETALLKWQAYVRNGDASPFEEQMFDTIWQGYKDAENTDKAEEALLILVAWVNATVVEPVP